MNWEFPEIQAGFRKGRRSRYQTANIRWIIEKARKFEKSIYFCFIDYTKAFDCVDHNKLWKILKEMGIPDHLTWLLIKLYAGQEATLRTRHGTMDSFQIGKGVCQGCTLSPCLFNLYAGWQYTALPSVVPCLVPTIASWPAYRFLRRQFRWSGIPISWRIFHSLFWFTQPKALS